MSKTPEDAKKTPSASGGFKKPILPPAAPRPPSFRGKGFGANIPRTPSAKLTPSLPKVSVSGTQTPPKLPEFGKAAVPKRASLAKSLGAFPKSIPKTASKTFTPKTASKTFAPKTASKTFAPKTLTPSITKVPKFAPAKTSATRLPGVVPKTPSFKIGKTAGGPFPALPKSAAKKSITALRLSKSAPGAAQLGARRSLSPISPERRSAFKFKTPSKIGAKITPSFKKAGKAIGTPPRAPLPKGKSALRDVAKAAPAMPAKVAPPGVPAPSLAPAPEVPPAAVPPPPPPAPGEAPAVPPAAVPGEVPAAVPGAVAAETPAAMPTIPEVPEAPKPAEAVPAVEEPKEIPKPAFTPEKTPSLEALRPSTVPTFETQEDEFKVEKPPSPPPSPDEGGILGPFTPAFLKPEPATPPTPAPKSLEYPPIREVKSDETRGAEPAPVPLRKTKSEELRTRVRRATLVTVCPVHQTEISRTWSEFRRFSQSVSKK